MLELAVCIGEMQFHSAQRHEQRLRDFFVAGTPSGQFRDATLAGGQRIGTDARPPSRAPARGAEFLFSAVG